MATHQWVNSIPREMAGCLEDRESDTSVAAAKWLEEHESDPEVWGLIGCLLDAIETMAAQQSDDKPDGS